MRTLRNMMVCLVPLLVFGQLWAQPGYGSRLFLFKASAMNDAQMSDLHFEMLPFNPVAGDQQWQAASPTILDGGWIAFEAHAQAFRFLRENEVMEIWLNGWQVELERNSYCPNLIWKPGSFDLLAKKLVLVENQSLRNTDYMVTGAWLKKYKLKPHNSNQ